MRLQQEFQGGAMARIERIYRPTESGQNARSGQYSGLPPEYLRILSFIQSETHSDQIRAGLRRYTDEEIFEWLADLEKLGYLVSERVTAKHDLDFTNSLSLSALITAHNA
jgi:hypothetical protein